MGLRLAKCGMQQGNNFITVVKEAPAGRGTLKALTLKSG